MMVGEKCVTEKKFFANDVEVYNSILNVVHILMDNIDMAWYFYKHRDYNAYVLIWRHMFISFGYW